MIRKIRSVSNRVYDQRRTNTAKDRNSVLRARAAKALRSWLSRLQVIVEQAQERGETRPEVDAKTVATLIVASLEGALMMSRLQRNEETLRRVQLHLNRDLEDEVAYE